jgi:hypothetical protein
MGVIWGRKDHMRTVVCGALAAIAIAGFTTAAEAKKCIKASGEGTGVTHELATELAKVALNNSITSWGGKAAGKASTSCKYELVLSVCKAQSRACK